MYKKIPIFKGQQISKGKRRKVKNDKDEKIVSEEVIGIY